MATDPADQRILDATKRSATRAHKGIEQARADGGAIGGWVGVKHQSENILAVTVFVLLAMISLTVVATIWTGIQTGNYDIFKNIGLPLLSAAMTIVGYMFGRNSNAPSGPPGR